MIPLESDFHVLAHEERAASLRRSFSAPARSSGPSLLRRSLGRRLIDLGLRLELGRSPEKGMPFPIP